jgi:hypothetical protein
MSGTMDKARFTHRTLISAQRQCSGTYQHSHPIVIIFLSDEFENELSECRHLLKWGW